MYNSTKLNIVGKTKSNPFLWRGQFTPALVEYFLEVHADANAMIADPFAGTGTVLLESSKKNLAVISCEINPAAYTMSKLMEIGTLKFSQKWDLCQEVVHLVPFLPANKLVYQPRNASNFRQAYKNLIDFGQKAIDAHTSQSQLVLILNVLFKMENYKKLNIEQAWHKAYHKISSFLFSLPESSSTISVLLSDVRNLPQHLTRKIDLVITSPPYINVFSYHQNHRVIMELLDFDLSLVALSEFGSNGKNRRNRFLTVIQYCLDMAQALASIRNSIAEHGKVVITIARESNVNQTTFYNGKIIKDICQQTHLFSVVDESQRFFQNKFGLTTHEDVLTLAPNKIIINEEIDKSARLVATFHLEEALLKVPIESIVNLELAIASVDDISSSPILNLTSF